MTKKYLIFYFLILAALLLGAAPVGAAEEVQATLTAGQSEVTVGDPVELTLEVTHPAGYQVIIPKLGQSWGNFEVRSQPQAEIVTDDDGRATTRITISVTLFEPGSFETPALPLTVTSGGGEVIEEVVPPISLTVISVLSEGDTTLKDIRPQVGMQIPPLWPWLLGAAGVMLPVSAGGVWLFIQWRGKRVLTDNRLPHQVALDELNRIAGLRLPEKGQYKSHYTLVTDCLRTYIESRFQVHALDRTTLELKVSLSGSSMSKEQQHKFTDLFMDSDLVKFAKLTPEFEHANQLTQQAQMLVEMTKPALRETAPDSKTADVFSQKPMEVTR